MSKYVKCTFAYHEIYTVLNNAIDAAMQGDKP